MRASILALALCLLLLAGCGRQGEQVGTAVITTGGAPAEPAPEIEPKDQPDPGTAAEPEEQPDSGTASALENPFEAMPEFFRFCSGAGGWSTELTIEEDGSFSGLFVDSDMGVTGEGYPDGTRYVCSFNGRFSQPERVDETTWSMEIETMELGHSADEAEEFVDGVRYVYSGPYGLEDAGELLVYSPESPADRLPEDFLFWVQAPYNWTPTEAGTLGLWGIYNAGEGYGFVGFA